MDAKLFYSRLDRQLGDFEPELCLALPANSFNAGGKLRFVAIIDNLFYKSRNLALVHTDDALAVGLDPHVVKPAKDVDHLDRVCQLILLDQIVEFKFRFDTVESLVRADGLEVEQRFTVPRLREGLAGEQ